MYSRQWKAAVQSALLLLISEKKIKKIKKSCLSPTLQPYFQEMSARWIIIADSMPSRAPLKKKNAAAFTVFIKYYCFSLEEREDLLSKKKKIQPHFMVAIDFFKKNKNYKAVSAFGWDPEGGEKKRQREKGLEIKRLRCLHQSHCGCLGKPGG